MGVSKSGEVDVGFRLSHDDPLKLISIHPNNTHSMQVNDPIMREHDKVSDEVDSRYIFAALACF